MNPRLASTALLVAFALNSADASAQEGAAEVARRDLIAQAEAAATEGDHARALQLGERAAQIRVTPTIHYFLAREHLALDHPVEALGYSGSCARAAEADPALRNRDAVLEACRAIATTTSQRVAHVTLQVSHVAPAGLSVRVQDAALPAALYGVAYPVTPGVVVVEASAPGHLPFRREMTVVAGQEVALDVRLDAVPVVAPPPPVVTPPVAAPRIVVAPPRRSIGPWIVAGGGVLAFLLSGVFYGLAMSERSARDVSCAGCRAQAQAHDARYADHLIATNVALGVGAAAVTGGLVWLLVDRFGRRDAARPGQRAHVILTSDGVAIGLTSSF